MNPAIVLALALGGLDASDGGSVQVVVETAPLLVVTPDGGAGPEDLMVLTPPPAVAGADEQIIILIPRRKPPPPPEPPKPLTVVFQHEPRPRVEWGQAGVELAVATGVNIVGSAAMFAVELIPTTIAGFFNAPGVANGVIYGFALADAFVLPFVTTMAIERVKANSRHYQLEGWGWWATYGTGVGVQLVSTIITFAAVNVNTLLTSTHLLVFAVLTPLSQTVAANYFAAPRDPLAPMEASYRRPVFDAFGRTVPTLTLLSGSF